VDTEAEASVQAWARELAVASGMRAVPFLDQLTQVLYARTAQQSRLVGAPQPAALTLALGQGSCRDVAALFISACRSLGLPSRFMSGYLAPFDSADVPRQLHVWPEVYMPGSGFRGWDPAQGRRVADGHVPLCAAIQQNDTLPVEGGYAFCGSSVTTSLDYDIRIANLTA
jgi:transglutaminase-like putative cysteine protease